MSPVRKSFKSVPRSTVDPNNSDNQPEATIQALTFPFQRLHGFKLLQFDLRVKLRSFKRKTFSPGAFQLNSKELVKHGYRVRLTEAIAMDFIARNTTIPVPRVLKVLEIRGSTHIVQEYIDAPLLIDVWKNMGTDDRKSAMLQLKGYLDQLRAPTPPEPGKVQAIDGTGCLDDRLRAGEWGPFESHDAFNDAFFHSYVREHPKNYSAAQSGLAKTKGRTWRTVFAHGDLGPHNILWKDGRIVGIIDWECAGWFPEYWEYTRSFFGKGCSSWWEMFQEIADQYPDELEVEQWLASYFVRF